MILPTTAVGVGTGVFTEGGVPPLVGGALVGGPLYGGGAGVFLGAGVPHSGTKQQVSCGSVTSLHSAGRLS